MQFNENGAAQAESWAAWVAKYMCFFLHCVGQYAASKAQEDAGASSEQPDLEFLPCIRLLADTHFMYRLQQVCMILKHMHACMSLELGVVS